MASFLNVCRFFPASSGTGNFVVSSAVQGYQTPASAQAVNGAIYKYRAESADLTQWEVGYGAYAVAGTTLARTTILFNSSGGTSAISFTAVPQVAIVGLAEDLDPIDGALFGLTLSTAGASATFSVAAGWAADSTAVNILRNYASIAKTTSAWAVGAAAGSLDTGAIAASTWYHVFLIKRLDTGVTDILTSLSATAPTMPASYTVLRRVGSMKTNASSQWIQFTQDGDDFFWASPVQDVAVLNPGTVAVSRTLSTPLGVRNKAYLAVGGENGASTGLQGIYISDLSNTDVAPGTVWTSYIFMSPAPSTDFLAGSCLAVYTNTSSQVRTRVQTSPAAATLIINTLGWADTRGRLS